jgi:hypothetical protein
LAGADVGIDPRAQDVLLRFDVIGNELSAWAWREGDPMPAEPQVTAVHSELAAGEVIVAADLGWRLSNNEAIFRYVEVYEPTPTTPDFNGDSIVDAADMCMMIDYWGTDESLYDIAPLPFGDGVVDVQDLIVLAEHLFEDYRLVAHWKLDETEGSIAYDSVGDYDGTINGNPSWQPAEGKIDGALQFDGIDDCISTDFVLNPADSAFSVIVWVKGGVAGQVILSQANGTNWLCTDSVEGFLMTELKKDSGRFKGIPLSSETIINDGNWHRIGFVWDGLYRHLYVDGVEVASDAEPLSGLSDAYGGLYIGTGSNCAEGTFFSGLIDDIRIYNRVVSP